MSIWIILIIILFAGIFGGLINYLLPSNTNDTGKIRSALQCIILGIGASILVPLFLEIAQSKLMDNIHYGWCIQDNTPGKDSQKKDTARTTSKPANDTARKTAGDTAIKTDTPPKPNTAAPKAGADTKPATPGTTPPTGSSAPLKNYLLFLGYCFVAAAAGIRFINNLIDKVVVEKQLAQKDEQLAQSEAEKEKIEKERLQRATQDRKEAEEKEKEQTESGKVRMTTVKSLTQTSAAIGPVTVQNDRQKGRFGGKAENKGRKISATPGNQIGGFYSFTLTVESTSDTPLAGEVLFYLHDSFTPNVVTVPVDETGKAVYENLAYGAFTAGAVCDGGQTLLEIDLAEEKSFPKEFRDK